MEIGIKSRSLPRFRILQVGDVHYPEWSAAPAALDIKTRQLSGEVMEGLTTDGFQNLLRTISRNEFIDGCDAVVFVGDYTTRGDQPQMDRALRHLAGLFRVNAHSPRPKFHAVPGNHDVSRELAQSHGMIGKFDRLAELVKSLGFSPLPVLSPVAVTSGDSGRPLTFFLTNTTLGSWEKVGLPESVSKWIEKTASELEGKDSREGEDAIDDDSDGGRIPVLDPSSYYDQLDTPFISKRALLEIKAAISSDDEAALPCVVGHHNILPQATPRVAPFGELLNQGEFRSTLLSTGRPILYLHGHIHTDPVEVVTSPSNPGSKVISIGAPTLSEGVNVLDIFFSRAGEPIGLMIFPVRIDDKGHVVARGQMEVPLQTHGSGAVVGQLASQVATLLSPGRKTWAELRNGLSAADASDDDLEAVAMELVWSGVVKIINQAAPRQRWFLELNR